MRRYDPGFVELRRTVSEGRIGSARLVHAAHRNASSLTSTNDAGLITGSMVHELDTIPWLLGDQIMAIRVESPVLQGFRDPQIATLWLRGGAMATVEVFVNARYGYDVRCEVVGTSGTAVLEPSSIVSTRLDGFLRHRVRDDFIAHFADAYRLQLDSWVRSVLTDRTADGPSAWDGYLATVVARAGVTSLITGERVEVHPGPAPKLYDSGTVLATNP